MDVGLDSPHRISQMSLEEPGQTRSKSVKKLLVRNAVVACVLIAVIVITVLICAQLMMNTKPITQTGM